MALVNEDGSVILAVAPRRAWALTLRGGLTTSVWYGMMNPSSTTGLVNQQAAVKSAGNSSSTFRWRDGSLKRE